MVLRSEIWFAVDNLEENLTQLEEQRKNIAKHVSRVDELIEEDYQKLDTNVKDYMDSIKILARNIRKY